MKTIKLVLITLLFALMGHASTSLAEDTDIYGGLGGAAGVPNVMIIIDNAANSNANMSACTYWDGTHPAASIHYDKSLDNYMCALDTIAHGMTTKSDGTALVNLGITTQAGVYLRLTPVDDHVYTGTFAHTAGQTNRQVLSAAIRALTDVPGNATQGTSFQETWAYYTGGNGGSTNVGIISGTTYTGTNATTGCQKNFAIFISGVTPSAHANTNGSELTQLTAVLNNAVTADTITSAQRTAMLTTVSTGESPYAVEWARLMKTLDINATAAGTGMQSITTYSVAAGSPVYPAAMDSMEKYIYSTALYGGGKYFAATSYASIYQSILAILNEVQAVNSVFSASSLPVSVNAQGTYLNQIYMGMFRPDETGAPRWMGNMKQYSFIATRDATSHLISLSLGDSLGATAISSGGTGFISPNAVSYWTCGGSPVVRACSPVADPAAGFWKNNPQGAGAAFDLPDGELVEKGGAAQIMRLASLTADYTTAAGLSTNPRKLYTYCPSGASCNTALTHASNAFATTNADITATMFGSSSSLIISSIVRTGTTALVTTNTAHGYADGASVTISGATQTEYNVTQAINYANPHSATTFTITGLPDYPTTPSTGAYTAALHNSTTKAITGVSVATSTTANANACTSGTIPNINCVRVTVTSPAHGYSDTNNVVIAGVSPAQYSGTFTIANVTADTFTYDVPVTPKSPSVNAYSVKLPTPASKTVTEIKKVTGNCTVFATAHGYSNGASVTISGNTAWNGTYTVASATANTFQIALNCNSTGTGGNVVLDTPTISIAAGNISRASATATTATAVAASAVTHNATYTLAYVSGSGSNEAQYAASGGSRSVAVTCSSGATCTTFTFPLDATVFSTTLTTSSPTVALSGAPVAIVAGKITRSETTATVTNVAAASAFATGQYIDIGVSGASVGTESAYLSPADGWQITCPVACATAFTFGPVTLSPTTPATTGSSMRVYQGSTPPDKDPLIKWVRGEDNFGDEKSLCPPGSTAGVGNCPNPKVTVRPSFHGDVLHSRPIAINYGGTIGVVVYYGANDGVYRAVNGNQTNPAGSALPVPGSELWGFIPTDFFGNLNRQRTNSPLLQMPSTPPGIAPTPEKKNYFADGSTSVYQLLNADGTTHTAYIYLAMRRGGDFIYALDVSTPTSPVFMWKLDPSGFTTSAGFTSSADFAELGQTWSAPKVALIKGYNDGSGNAKPVMIFGGGYSTTQDEGYDSEGKIFSASPSADSSGRGIFIVDAATGALVWRATYGASPNCTTATNPKCACAGVGTLPGNCTLSEMTYSIPSDITLMDRDNDGYIDRLYAVDVGGNVWRVDLQREGNTTHNTPDYWKVNQVASLGDGGAGNPRRKFFFPPDVLPTTTFDAVVVGSGDREHPLSSTATRDRIYVLKDLSGNDGSSLITIVAGHLFDATSVAYAAAALGSNGTTTPNKGYFKDHLAGEKVVNAPLTVAGYTYYGTNQPSASDSCSANLGIAKGYRLNALTGAVTYTVYDGGGLPPSPVAGVVNVTVTGEASSVSVPFCIGCGGDTSCTGSDCGSALGGAKPAISVPTSRTRTYWYQEVD